MEVWKPIVAKNEKSAVIDINKATQEELIKIYGIEMDFITF
jgi:DNA uptake protein ComE-like DNA-binding protein